MKRHLILLATAIALTLGATRAQPPAPATVPIEAAFWLYEATYVDAYDGDTVDVEIRLGLDTYRLERLRLFGVDTPELRGAEREAGLLVRDFVRSTLEAADQIVIRTEGDKRGKYGRLLATILVDGVNLNAWLLELEYAVPYFGGTR